jgi:diguanylate cyclase (GGDEF)-like protein
MRNAPREARDSADPELRAVMPSIPAGVASTALVAVAAIPYIAVTWEEPNRTGLAVLLCVAVLGTVPFLFIPGERVLAAPRRSFFFLAWSAIDIVLISLLAILDGGISSPFTVLLFLTQAFAAVFYPVRLVVIAAVLNLAGLTAIAVLGDPQPLTATLFEGAALLGTSLLCAWAARNAAEQRRELARASRSDPLTGCLNRRGFEEQLAREVRRSQREGVPFALVAVDLDDFKRVNDERGHAAGDSLLCELVTALAAVVRGMDAVGRLGGDEFALLFPAASCRDLEALMRRVEASVADLCPCSLGAACFPEHGESADALMNRADQEMYRNKRLTLELAADLDQPVAIGSSRTTSMAGLSSRNPL